MRSGRLMRRLCVIIRMYVLVGYSLFWVWRAFWKGLDSLICEKLIDFSICLRSVCVSDNGALHNL